VIHSDLPIKSIEIQLIRVETCGCAEGYAKEGEEITLDIFALKVLSWFNH